MEGLSEPDVGPFWVPIQRVSRSTADMEEVGELKDLLAGGVIPAVEVGNLVFSETLLVFGAVDVGIDFGVEALFLQDGEVLAHFSLVLGSAPEKMLEVELDEPVRVGAFEEALAVEAAFGDLADQFAHTQIAATEQGFRALKAIALENVLKTQNLLVNRPNQCGRIGFGGIQPAFLVLRGRETVNAQIGSVDECHGRAGRGGETGPVGRVPYTARHSRTGLALAGSYGGTTTSTAWFQNRYKAEIWRHLPAPIPSGHALVC
jgi:hypothetical protein